jgi:uncharacterized membrane protein YvbJ
MENQLYCKYCGKNALPEDYFCSKCGKKLREKPQPVTVGRQILIYLLSFLLPPLGLWPAVKYLRQKDGKSKAIGYVAVVLTVIATVIAIWTSLVFMDYFNRQLNTSLYLLR